MNLSSKMQVLLVMVSIFFGAAAVTGWATAMVQKQAVRSIKQEGAEWKRKAEKAYTQYMLGTLPKDSGKPLIPKGTYMQSNDGGETFTFVVPNDY